MMFLKITVLLVCYVHIVICQMDKGSLTFVIDDTGSMQYDIDQVKDGVNLIFDSVINSEDSPIEDVLVVTFNDEPEHARFLTTTRNPAIFKEILSGIKAGGGGDCPESCLSGIRLGLEKSRNGSFIYVFTDDVADDTQFLSEVQNLAISKKTQVNFILTFNRGCAGRNHGPKPEYKYYYDLAAATKGAVFSLAKSGVTEILNHVSENIKSRRTEIVSRTLPAGYGHEVTIPVDPAMKDPILSCTGTKPKIEDITAPDGTIIKPTKLVDQPGATSVKLPNLGPGNYTAKAGSESESAFKADATTTISFKYGFSPSEPSTMADIPSLPIKDSPSHICVQIFSKDKYIPYEIILSGISGKLIQNVPLKLVNAKENIYITDKIVPPDGLFKVAVLGYHEESKSIIIRESETFLEVQKYSGTPKPTSPTTIIDNGPIIEVDYGNDAKLVCNVEAYPKPTIKWKDEDGTTLPTEVVTYKLPSSFMAELVLNNISVTKTYSCSAANENGDSSQKITVKTERKTFLDISQRPKDTNIAFKGSAEIYCKVDAYPLATITWVGPALSSTEEYIEISKAKDSLTIKQMIPEFVGDYKCSVTNGMKSEDVKFKLDIIETKPETSVEGPTKVNVDYNQPLFLRCLVKGYPKPKITWLNKKTGKEIPSAPVAASSSFHYGMEMQLEKVNENATYKCVAENRNGEHSSEVTVVTIQKEHLVVIEEPKDTTIKYKEEGLITCKVDAYPQAEITWRFESDIIENDDHYEISSDGFYLKIKDMQPNLKGDYSCRAINKFKRSKIMYFSIDISGTEPPQIDKTKSEYINVKEGDPVEINCRIIKGTPPPTLFWEFQSVNDDRFREMGLTENTIHFEKVTSSEYGIYRCTASNSEGTANRDVDLTVEYPPTIDDGEKQKDSKDGTKTTLGCKARGYPKPAVVWSVGGVNITDGPEYKIFRDNSLRFSASLKNNGIFTCTAVNVHGAARREIQVDYYKEVKVVIPDETSFKTFVGEKERLHCEADGYPAPVLTWQFRSSANPGDDPIVIKTATSPDTLVKKFNSVSEDGFYICYASNQKSNQSLAFTVEVEEPVHIIPNAASSRPTKAVKGDLVRIPCHAVGKPEPSVNWMKNGYDISIGHNEYSMDKDGSLLIEGIKEGGLFICKAKNAISGPEYMKFEVELRDYPKQTKIHKSYILKAGKPAKVECPISHKLVDVLRWYKGSELKATGELEFDSLSISDAGVYTCRVSHRITIKSESKSVQITVY